jgi:hypothetical protein
MAMKPTNAVPNLQNAEGIGMATAFSLFPSVANESSKFIALTVTGAWSIVACTAAGARNIAPVTNVFIAAQQFVISYDY